MKTREQIYGQEAASLLRDITTYHCLRRAQLLRMYPGKEDKIINLLAYFVKQGRAFYHEAADCYCDSADTVIDTEMLAALWVLADFMEQVEYHGADEMPVKLVFFADGEVYEVVCVPPDKAALMTHALVGKEDQIGKRLVIIELPEQIDTLNIPGAAAYCIVDAEGRIQYFKKE
ncbi:MAG: DUF5697 family protein [Oscillospiraceae bacterium]|nr:DUF5697 family protein [Oscillospiraceae bacterium]